MRDPNYDTDRRFGDAFMPEVKAIMGRILLTADCGDEDTEHNTDLIVISMDKKRIGVRIRRHRFYDNYDHLLECPYRDEFTVRYSKDAGGKTEFEKIIEGFGDYFFYGYADEQDRRLCKWVVIDYATFRKFVCMELWKNGGSEFVKNRIFTNPNGDKFLSFRIAELPPDAIVASSEHWEKVLA